MYRYNVTVESTFEAAHFLRTYKGIEEPLHGHTWKVEAEFFSEKLDQDQVSVDFLPVRAVLHKTAIRLDHSNLNEIPPFNDINPSAERVAHWFWEQLLPEVPKDCTLIAITVWEGAGQRVRVEKRAK